jgi:CubicO group peptidase (beta-lactamase class C family)
MPTTSPLTPSAANAADPFRQWTPEEIIAIGLDAGRFFVPGESWAYSHTHYVILGLAMEQILDPGRGPEDHQQLLKNSLASGRKPQPRGALGVSKTFDRVAKPASAGVMRSRNQRVVWP